MLFTGKKKNVLANFSPITGDLEMKFSKDSLTWTCRLGFLAPPEIKHTCDVHLFYRRVLCGGRRMPGCVFLTDLKPIRVSTQVKQGLTHT